MRAPFNTTFNVYPFLPFTNTLGLLRGTVDGRLVHASWQTLQTPGYTGLELYATLDSLVLVTFPSMAWVPGLGIASLNFFDSCALEDHANLGTYYTVFQDAGVVLPVAPYAKVTLIVGLPP